MHKSSSLMVFTAISTNFVHELLYTLIFKILSNSGFFQNRERIFIWFSIRKKRQRFHSDRIRTPGNFSENTNHRVKQTTNFGSEFFRTITNNIRTTTQRANMNIRSFSSGIHYFPINGMAKTDIRFGLYHVRKFPIRRKCDCRDIFKSGKSHGNISKFSSDPIKFNQVIDPGDIT